MARRPKFAMIIIEDLEESAQPIPSQIASAIDQLYVDEDIIWKDRSRSDAFIRTIKKTPHRFLVECVEGQPPRWCSTSLIGERKVKQLFQAYVRGDQSFKSMADWHDITKKVLRRITLKWIPRFHARGMRRLHCLDAVVTRRVFRREIWAAKDGRLLVRFLCPSDSDEDTAYEIRGLIAPDLTHSDLNATPNEDYWPRWVPECVSEAWCDWWFSAM